MADRLLLRHSCLAQPFTVIVAIILTFEWANHFRNRLLGVLACQEITQRRFCGLDHVELRVARRQYAARSVKPALSKALPRRLSGFGVTPEQIQGRSPLGEPGEDLRIIGTEPLRPIDCREGFLGVTEKIACHRQGKIAESKIIIQLDGSPSEFDRSVAIVVMREIER